MFDQKLLNRPDAGHAGHEHIQQEQVKGLCPLQRDKRRGQVTDACRRKAAFSHKGLCNRIAHQIMVVGDEYRITFLIYHPRHRIFVLFSMSRLDHSHNPRAVRVTTVRQDLHHCGYLAQR